MLRKILIGACLICSLYLANVPTGYSSQKNTATAAARFLRLAPDARSQSLAGAVVADPDDASALYWNPSGLGDAGDNSVLVSTRKHLEGTYSSFTQIQKTWSPVLAAATAVQMNHYGTLEAFDVNGRAQGNLSPYDVTVTLGAASSWKNFRWGAGIKYLRSHLTETATTATFDCGLLSPYFWRQRLRWGWRSANLGGSLRYKTEANALPLLHQTGFYCRWNRWIESEADISFPKDDAIFYHTGTEISWAFHPNLCYQLRWGYSSQYAGEEGLLKGLSLGSGMTWGHYRFDYAAQILGDVGNSHTFTLAYIF